MLYSLLDGAVCITVTCIAVLINHKTSYMLKSLVCLGFCLEFSLKNYFTIEKKYITASEAVKSIHMRWSLLIRQVTPSVCCCSPTSLLFLQEFIYYFQCNTRSTMRWCAWDFSTRSCYSMLLLQFTYCHNVFTYSVEALHVWHLQLIWKQSKFILYNSNLWLNGWKDSASIKSNLLFLSYYGSHRREATLWSVAVWWYGT